MKDYPILFFGPMVRAIRAGQKTVTRRMSKRWLRVKAGDRLWVRETWARAYVNGRSLYRADSERDRLTLENRRWRLAIFMPRGVSRILLEATEDAEETELWSMDSAEALREGVEVFRRGGLYYLPGNGDLGVSEPVTAFGLLWDSLHKVGQRWEDKPTVVRVAFKTVSTDTETEVRDG